jgi:hypothetical protein
VYKLSISTPHTGCTNASVHAQIAAERLAIIILNWFRPVNMPVSDSRRLANGGLPN